MIDLIGKYITLPLVVPVSFLISGIVFLSVKGVDYLMNLFGKKIGFLISFFLFSSGIVAYPPVVHHRIHHHPLGDSTQRKPDRFIALSQVINSPNEEKTKNGEEYTDLYYLHFHNLFLEGGLLFLWLWGLHFLRWTPQVIERYAAGSVVSSIILPFLGLSPVWSIAIVSLVSGTVCRKSVQAWKTLPQQHKKKVRITVVLLLLFLNGLFLCCRLLFLFDRAWDNFRA